MAVSGNVSHIDEIVNNHRHGSCGGQVRHSAGVRNGTAAPQHRHSASRCRRRPVTELETAIGDNDVFTNDSSAHFVEKAGFAPAISNGTPQPRVGTIRNKTTQVNGDHSREHCQDAFRDVENADSNVISPTRSQNFARILSDERKNRPASDGSPREICDRTAARIGFPKFVSNPTVDVPTTNGVQAIEYPNPDGNRTVSDVRNETRIVRRFGSESDAALAKVGDFDREREIERRMRELGLWESKKAQERHLAEQLDTQISERDGLTAALRRCRRRHRGESNTAVNDIRHHICQEFIRDVWGVKVAYEVRILMGCFTTDVAYMNSGNVVTVRGVTSDPGVKLTKEMTVEMPSSADGSKVNVSYSGGVVRIRAPFSCRTRNHARTYTRSVGSSADSSLSSSSRSISHI